MKLQLDRLNELELEIHEKLIQESKNRSSLTITEAAELTDVSISKISKFVKKLGFNGYKEYARFLTGKELITRKKKILNLTELAHSLKILIIRIQITLQI